MRMLRVHLWVYAVVNSLLVLIWFMAGQEPGFWPKWVIGPWGWAVVVQYASVLWFRNGRRAGRAQREQRSGRQWIAAMFTDLVGSSALAERWGDEAWTELIETYRRTAQSVATAHHGTIVGTQGDGLLMTFPSPADALHCAGALQRRCARGRDEGDGMPPLRIGIHAGEAVAVKGDVLGQMINVAARIAAIAGPDEILVSEPVADHAEPGMHFDDHGLHTIAGSSKPRHLLVLQWRGFD